MQSTTTIRLGRSTQRSLRELADADGITLDEEVQRLVRSERQRRMGDALARWEPDRAASDWLDESARTVTGIGTDAGR
jgi:hypothetical protein